MATQTRKKTGININIDFARLQAQVMRQFQGIDPNDPGRWPLLPRALAYVATTLLVVVLGWYLLLSDEQDELATAGQQEQTLREQYRAKLAKSINLGALKSERVQVQGYVDTLERQLPGKAEMDALLSEINQAGIGRGLQFVLFKPGSVIVRDYYAELPITMTVTGSYHDIGLFASDLANLPRIVTLNDIALAPATKTARGSAAVPGGVLTMNATVKTFRYLDPDEIAAQHQASAGKKS